MVRSRQGTDGKAAAGNPAGRGLSDTAHAQPDDR